MVRILLTRSFTYPQTKSSFSSSPMILRSSYSSSSSSTSSSSSSSSSKKRNNKKDNFPLRPNTVPIINTAFAPCGEFSPVVDRMSSILKNVDDILEKIHEEEKNSRPSSRVPCPFEFFDDDDDDDNKSTFKQEFENSSLLLDKLNDQSSSSSTLESSFFSDNLQQDVPLISFSKNIQEEIDAEIINEFREAVGPRFDISTLSVNTMKAFNQLLSIIIRSPNKYTFEKDDYELVNDVDTLKKFKDACKEFGDDAFKAFAINFDGTFKIMSFVGIPSNMVGKIVKAKQNLLLFAIRHRLRDVAQFIHDQSQTPRWADRIVGWAINCEPHSPYTNMFSPFVLAMRQGFFALAASFARCDEDEILFQITDASGDAPLVLAIKSKDKDVFLAVKNSCYNLYLDEPKTKDGKSLVTFALECGNKHAARELQKMHASFAQIEIDSEDFNDYFDGKALGPEYDWS